ncbi:MAG: 16S rRNA (uracil(1498)-N(3))-methyltransferase [Thermodesulfobacteriota bacterium]
MRRFFFNPDLREEDTVLLSEQESRHITRVLRLDIGTELLLLDGQGGLYRGRISALGRQVLVSGLRQEPVVEEQGPRVHVYQGLLKGQKMELLVQKCSELGAASFTPFFAERCQGSLARKSVAEKKMDRYRKISDEACKQCGRVKPMALERVDSIEDALGSLLPQTLGLFFWEEEKGSDLHGVPDLRNIDDVALFLGPEGGFTGDEAELARSSGCRILSLGPRILRAETACISALAVVQFLADHLSGAEES